MNEAKLNTVMGQMPGDLNGAFSIGLVQIGMELTSNRTVPALARRRASAIEPSWKSKPTNSEFGNAAAIITVE